MTKQRARKASGTSSSTRERSSGGNATQIILNVAASVAELYGSKNVPRERLVNFTNSQMVMGKSTFANALTKLKKDGLIIMNSGVITITQKGMDRAVVKDLSNATNEDFHKSMKEQSKLTARQCELFDYLADGKIHKKKEAAAAIGCKMNSTWSNMLTRMKKLGIVEFQKETINLTKTMFPFEIPGR